MINIIQELSVALSHTQHRLELICSKRPAYPSH